jgi:hypothetical protein
MGVDFWRDQTDPNVGHNGTDSTVDIGVVVWLPGQLSFHPGPHGEFSVVRWTAPESGTIALATTFTGLDYFGPTTTDVHILQNGVPVFNGDVYGFGSSSGPSFTGNLTVSAGDTVDFAVGIGSDGTYEDDTTGLDATVSYTAPSVTASVAQSLLWPPFHRLVNVGLSVDVTPPDATLQLLVYGNDHASSSDVRDIAPDTLQVRAARQLLGTGRVYLVVAEATILGGTSFDVTSVVVPRFNTPDDIASVQLQALGAETWYRLFQTAPPGFHLLGEGTSGGSGAASPGQSGRSAIPGDIVRLHAFTPAIPLAFPNQESLLGVDNPAVPAEHLPSAWVPLPMDGYLATTHEEAFGLTLPALDHAGWREVDGPALDGVLKDDGLVV